MAVLEADVFEDQVAGHRGELFAHCYRMLGTVDEAEDALQEALARAWQGRATYREHISFRAWLYRIATNTCINAIAARKRERTEPGPCPDDLLVGIASTEAGPDARYDMHESVSLAFLTVLQVLPARQRAVLLLRDVLAFRGAEVARLLETSVHAVNSSLQRARATLRSTYVQPRLADPPRLLDRYVRAWESADVAGLVALLREDAILAMPPRPSVVGARSIGAFLAGAIFPMGPARLVATRANHSPAFAAYMRNRLFALLVIDGDGDRIAQIHAYADPRAIARFDLPDQLAG
ncbi:MAG TPA: sigma-70 family RNA polymerase sigma factor [Candidatus Limnocylindrales bacterium]|nr:sigma-70 family RNA polymerase sigma factor [Candidatus Limnocylindrales bacterium]